jgi:hypothetical protein
MRLFSAGGPRVLSGQAVCQVTCRSPRGLSALLSVAGPLAEMACFLRAFRVDVRLRSSAVLSRGRPTCFADILRRDYEPWSSQGEQTREDHSNPR